ncbi:hypothetical protein J7L29_03290 [Candidatus Bathyarchaeota archaeon]|nr:hypothetical protein [Candidatus Bathyarchaeota archaeon]
MLSEKILPLTPFHLGPALFLGLALLRYLDFPTFLIANVIVDVEPLIIILLGLGYPLHGFLHSFIGGTLAAIALAMVMVRVRGRFNHILSIFKIEQESSAGRILAASLLGVYIRILLDSRMHPDVKPFYPIPINPFLGGVYWWA